MEVWAWDEGKLVYDNKVGLRGFCRDNEGEMFYEDAHRKICQGLSYEFDCMNGKVVVLRPVKAGG